MFQPESCPEPFSMNTLYVLYVYTSHVVLYKPCISPYMYCAKHGFAYGMSYTVKAHSIRTCSIVTAKRIAVVYEPMPLTGPISVMKFSAGTKAVSLHNYTCMLQHQVLLHVAAADWQCNNCTSRRMSASSQARHSSQENGAVSSMITAIPR